MSIFLIYRQTFVFLINYNGFGMNLRFTKKQEEHIAQQVATGEYQNNNEVIRDAIRLHRIYREKGIEDLR